MKSNKLVRFWWKDSIKGITVLYTFIVLSIVTVLLIGALSEDSHILFSGTETTSIIYLLISGIVSYRTLFHICLQNGISRKTMFQSYLIFSLLLSGGMALIERIIYSLLYGNKLYVSMFDQIYDGLKYDSFLLLMLTQMFWYFSMFFFSCMFGYFISALFYHLDRVKRLYVFLGVPVTIVVLIPLFDYFVMKGRITNITVRMLKVMFGVNQGFRPYNLVITCILAALIFAILGRLISRRCVLRKA